jgi:hypothetical protein
MGLRAFVMARKGVLLSDPSVKNMSLGQWIFEYHALAKRESDTFTTVAKALKAILINVMGLNTLRPEDEQGSPKLVDNMTDEEKEAFLPLIAWVGRPEMLKLVKDQIEVDTVMSETDDNKEYEKLVDSIDANDGDMEPMMGPVLLPPISYKQEIFNQQMESMKVEKYPGANTSNTTKANIKVGKI